MDIFSYTCVLAAQQQSKKCRTRCVTSLSEEEKSLSTEQDVHEVISTGPVSRHSSQLPLSGHSCAKEPFFFSEHPNRQAIRMAPNHPAANQRGWLPRRVVINPLNRSMKDLCCHQDIYRPDSRFRNQSDTSVQSKGWLHLNFYRSEPCSAGKCSNQQGGIWNIWKERI